MVVLPAGPQRDARPFGGHTTTTAGNKIYYYPVHRQRQLPVRRARVPVCGSKPVRADYLDTVVWEHITSLLADLALIRAEIGKRLEQPRLRPAGSPGSASTSNWPWPRPLDRCHGRSLFRAADHDRRAAPTGRADLHAREASLRAQLDAQAADRDAYLKLADDLEGFLARLRGSTATATTEDRRRVLRLLVKDVLIGPEKITIRHRIPVREPAGRDAATTANRHGG